MSLTLAICLALALIPMSNVKVNAASEMLEEPVVSDLNTNVEYNIVLDENLEYRWNANGEALKRNVIHLYDTGGKNCNFKFHSVPNNKDELSEDQSSDGYYGISHVKTAGTDYFVDVDGKNTNENSVLHLWSEKTYNEFHQQFRFYYKHKCCWRKALLHTG